VLWCGGQCSCLLFTADGMRAGASHFDIIHKYLNLNPLFSSISKSTHSPKKKKKDIDHYHVQTAALQVWTAQTTMSEYLQSNFCFRKNYDIINGKNGHSAFHGPQNVTKVMVHR